MSLQYSVSPCPICEKEHHAVPGPDSDGGSTSTATSTGNDNSIPMIHGGRAPGPRNRWAADIRCPLPNHVLDSRILIVDHNAINQRLMGRTLEKFGLCCDKTACPEEAQETYRNDPMRYNIICMDPMPNRPVTGVDAFRQIREFERTNNIPPCFLIASDGARSMLMERNGLRQMVVNCGVDCVLPWYRNAMPLYDALAGMKERGEWCDRPDVLSGVSVAERTAGTGAAGAL